MFVQALLKLSELEIIQAFRQPGGSEFAQFCTEIINLSCGSHGVPLSEVSTTARTDAKDGGVDTRVAVGLPNDKTGYLETKSAWQFKAADETNITAKHLKTEAQKPYSKQCIRSGHAYRVCICDHLTPQKRASLEGALEVAVRRINKAAPPSRVLGVSEICQIANLFPALVMRFRPQMSELCMLFEHWEQTATGITPKFVPNPVLASLETAISHHTDFSKTPPNPVLAIHGSSGVGKTRTVFEALKGRPDVRSLVIYSSDEDRFGELANLLIHYQPAFAIFVADECSVSSRVQLSNTLRGVRDRIRCICIDNSSVRFGSVAPELLIPKPTILELQTILKDNFPQIAQERIRAYAQLSEGFVRIAADMCGHYDETIKQAGDMSPIAHELEAYFEARLETDERRKAVEAIALLKRVKRKGDTPTELDSLCR